MRPAYLLLVPFLGLTAFAQQPPQAEPATSTGTQTIRTGTQLVVVDVNVTDAAGNPVHHLNASDFKVLENKVPQQVEHFEEHAAPTKLAAIPALPRLEPGVYTNFSLVPDDGPLNVLLLDTLNTPTDSQMMARQKMIAFLQGIKPNQRIAIFGLSSRLYLLQGFTSDPALLRAAISGKHGSPKSSPLLADPLGTETASDQMDAAFGNTPGMAQVVANMQQFEAMVATEQVRDRVLLTLTALNQLARYLNGLQGRKNLIWMSGSFPLNVLPNGDLPNPFAAAISMEGPFRETTNLLTRSQVSVFPIDARGLFNAPMLDASTQGTKYARSPTAFSKDMQKFSQNTMSEHTTMEAMAEATGGKAYVDGNDLGGAVDAALNAGSNYYTLTYSPTNRDWNSRYRKIVVQVGSGKTYTLTYRRGYYADDPSKMGLDHDSTAATKSSTITIDPLSTAMQRGSPNPTQLLFKALIVPSSALVDKLADGNVAAPKTKGPYRTFTIYLASNPGDFIFHAQPDGKRTSSIRFATVVYNRDGQPFTMMNHLTKADIPLEAYEQMLKGGLRYSEEISVPEKGEYFLRIGMEDMFSGKVGSIEIPASIVPMKAVSPAH